MKKTVLIIFVSAVLLTALCGCEENKNTTEEPFRLHIIANSDCEFDQNVKLNVRDAVLEYTKEGLGACKSEKEAEKYVTENIDGIVKTADETLLRNGAEYKASAQIGVFEFPDRVYGDVTYPAGDYYAMRLVLGNGEGKNWWCVMFPPLCLVNTAEEPQNTEYRSAILDWINKNILHFDIDK